MEPNFRLQKAISTDIIKTYHNGNEKTQLEICTVSASKFHSVTK